ncbi:MAG TPA: 50S ribosomal protein L6 [Spirochaetota bacterium]|jgi:large subunit ribosomal protein L6|nr:50S ribosomal protein L6 [Spirochaetota bacterium]OQB00379.1 MAG: 50S ribosomal protein L6 [Spirochaetes bacterium ADurb.Bin218]HOK02223.1 50S ribosomal protein L6 [Spirochaetota bacterium]HOK93170.1 50S ribosomal protein L6 [Spirochaetota bacterium]HON17187.1 50S ribosomal protein L6 [Spirochaetota bacterium]
MSRIGKKPIEIPSNVTVTLDGKNLSVKGPLGENKLTLLDGVKIEINDKILKVDVEDHENRQHRAYHGLFRTLINNMVVGVSQGFVKELEIVGVGYRAIQQGKDIQFQLGYSHPILFPAPEGITLEVTEATKFKVKGYNKELVGQVAANIRKLRGPEPYKGKGIRYKNENIRKKAGKTGKK